MVRIGLQVKGTLENVTDVTPDEDGGYMWVMKLKCSSCGTETEKWQHFDDRQEQKLNNSRGSAHFVLRCKFCGRENYLNIIAGSLGKYTADDNGKWKLIVQFDCRGAEPVQFQPSKPWCAASINSNTKFDDINLGEDWADYDEDAQESVGIYELEGKFITLRN